MESFYIDTCSTSPDLSSPGFLTSISRPPECHLFPRSSVTRSDHLEVSPFYAYDDATTSGSEPFAHYVRRKNNYIDVLTPQEEVEKFKREKASRSSFESEPPSPERHPSSPFSSNQPNQQSREDSTYLEVIGEAAKDDGIYVDAAQLEPRDGKYEKKESLMQFSMDGYDSRPSSIHECPLFTRDSPSSARASLVSTRASHASARQNSQASQINSVAFGSVISEKDVPGDVFPHEPTKPTRLRKRISENDKESKALVSLSELKNIDPETRATLDKERDGIVNDVENDAIQNSENFWCVDTNSKTEFTWKERDGQCDTDSDHVEKSPGSEVGTSARNSRELSDEVFSGDEDSAAGGPWPSSDTSKRRESSDDSDDEGGGQDPRSRNVTMNDAIILREYSPQMLQDLLKRVANPQDYLSSNFASQNNHPPLRGESSVFMSEKESRQSSGEIKYVCGECGWHKRSKGRKRSALRKEKKCERCKHIIKSPKSPKKERSPRIMDRFKEVLHRCTSLDSLVAPDRPPLDKPNSLSTPPLFVKQLNSRSHTHNPALDSKRGVLGIAPSPAHTAHAQSILGDVRTSLRAVTPVSNENASPKSRLGFMSSLFMSHSERTLAKGSGSPTTLQESSKTSSEKDKSLSRTKSSPVFSGSTEGPFEAVTKKIGEKKEKPEKKLSGSNLPNLPEVECQVGEDTFQYVKARSLALRFMAANPSCIRAIPYQASEDVHDKSISMCLYLHTYGNGIPAELRRTAEDMFSDYNLEFFDLEREPLGEFVAPRFSNNPSEVKELADLAARIENNLPMFENRLNVMAVQPSYKISSSQEEDELCVTVYVLGKGRIPVGEEDFSEIQNFWNCPLNIVEGYFVSTGSPLPFIYGARPLHFGVGIGVKGENDAGTLGGFLKDNEDNKYILSCEHVLRKGSRDEISVIVQPAEDDARDAEKELSQRIGKNIIKIKEKERKSEMALDEQDKSKLSKGIKRQMLELEVDEERRNDAVSRDIATYSDGLRENWEYNGQKIFVDVAVAQLNQDEVEEITQEANENGTIFGFNDEKHVDGKITDWCEFEGDKSEIKFWKSGRTTEHTEGGKLYRSNFFVNQQGYSDVKCFAELSHCNFMTCCEPCAKNNNLIDVGLLNKRDLKCGKCNQEISTEKMARLWARNCFMILNMKEPFSDRGDSGSLVFDDEGSAWGIIIGSLISGHYKYTVAVPLDIAIKALEQRSGKKFSIWCINPSGH